MTIKNLMPWTKKENNELSDSRFDSPFHSLHREMNHLFDNFLSDFSGLNKYDDKFKSFNPKVNLRENENEIRVEVEIPGIDEKEINVEIKDHTLYIKGERKVNNEDKQDDYHIVESAYGSFYRSVDLPEGVDLDNIDANSKNGLMTIIIPKKEELKSKARKIDVKKVN